MSADRPPPPPPSGAPGARESAAEAGAGAGAGAAGGDAVGGGGGGSGVRGHGGGERGEIQDGIIFLGCGQDQKVLESQPRDSGAIDTSGIDFFRGLYASGLPDPLPQNALHPCLSSCFLCLEADDFSCATIISFFLPTSSPSSLPFYVCSLVLPRRHRGTTGSSAL